MIPLNLPYQNFQPSLISGILTWYLQMYSNMIQGRRITLARATFFFDHILNEAGRQSLIDNIARHISNTKQKSITVHTIANFVSVDPGYSHLVGRKG